MKIMGLDVVEAVRRMQSNDVSAIKVPLIEIKHPEVVVRRHRPLVVDPIKTKQQPWQHQNHVHNIQKINVALRIIATQLFLIIIMRSRYFRNAALRRPRRRQPAPITVNADVDHRIRMVVIMDFVNGQPNNVRIPIVVATHRHRPRIIIKCIKSQIECIILLILVLPHRKHRLPEHRRRLHRCPVNLYEIRNQHAHRIVWTVRLVVRWNFHWML